MKLQRLISYLESFPRYADLEIDFMCGSNSIELVNIIYGVLNLNSENEKLDLTMHFKEKSYE